MSWSESFDAVVDKGTRLVILGSMPGVRSLDEAQYYAHPRNAFWPIMQQLFGVDAKLPYDKRLVALNRAGVGLWDVYQQCFRPGSLDAAIDKTTAQVNDFAQLTAQCPELQCIGFNGKAAEQAFRKEALPVLDRPEQVHLVGLLSTSPANASWTLDQKAEQWRQVLSAVCPDLPFVHKESSNA